MSIDQRTVEAIATATFTRGEHMVRRTGFPSRLLFLFLPLAIGCALPAANRVPPEALDHPTRQDSVTTTTMLLYRLIREIDAEGRPLKALPSWLGDTGSTQRRALTDAWERPLDVQVRGALYELRSAGPDGSHRTQDDISAVGKLGRGVPCEVRRLQYVIRYDDLAPPCDETPPDTIYQLCDALKHAGVGRERVPPSDSVAAQGEHLVRAAWIVDGYGRELGTLPLALRHDPLPGQNAGRELIDLWGSVASYTRRGSAFELRSPGRDRATGSPDDIVVGGVLGTPVQCAFRVGGEVRSCALRPPPCGHG
ncbi:MAG TPA: hypothetical protein VFS20_16255 [Longimicrobium sp.]|nr:hypothetical protein [Longimicrobium sp.]